MIVVLDSGILGSITNPKPKSDEVKEVIAWAARLRVAGHTFAIPSIADYKTRRELLRLGSGQSIAAHEAFCQAPSNIYLPISDATLYQAARLWAQTRNEGRPTAKADALDGDVILCAQAQQAGYPSGTYVVATTNTRHLSLFVDTAEWRNIAP